MKKVKICSSSSPATIAVTIPIVAAVSALLIVIVRVGKVAVSEIYLEKTAVGVVVAVVQVTLES